MPRKYELKEILIENSTYANTHRLKLKLIDEGLLENKCGECGMPPEWNGKPLSLQLDHRNGVHNDHRIENLRLLCPNCHSQTETYAAKNTKGVGRGGKGSHPTCVDCSEVMKSNNRNRKRCRSCNAIYSRKVERPPIEVLRKEIAELGYAATGRKYGVADNTVRKWLKVV